MIKSAIVKAAVFAGLVLIGTVITGAVEPLVATDLSIKSQLADSDASAAGYQMYKSLRTYSPLIYMVIGVLMFRKELTYLYLRIGGKEDEKDND